VTVALEHFTAIMAENALRERLIDLAHPSLQALLYWHACEEIEHKSVAFDVLARINPSYALRMKGLALATIGLAGFWVAAMLMLLEQDREKGQRGALSQWRKVPKGPPISRKVFLRGIREYARRDFHPSQLDNAHLAEDYLAKAGLTTAVAEA
jgi:predicted metal-dependent hydrolase